MNQEPTANESANIPLADTIQNLRKELQSAQQRSAGENILFEIEKVELELQVVIGRKAKGQGGIEFYVVKAGGEVERSGETTHSIKLTLSPVSSASGGRIKVAAQGEEAPLRG